MMERNYSFSSLWSGIQGPTTVADQCLSRHQEMEARERDVEKGDDPNNAWRSLLGPRALPSYDAMYDRNNPGDVRSIRLQVVVWSIGSIDVLTGRVPMKFRVTIFWEEDDDEEDNAAAAATGPHRHSPDLNGGRLSPSPPSPGGMNHFGLRRRPSKVWVMQGRHRACEKTINGPGDVGRTIDVPSLSILNADSFEVIGAPEVVALRRIEVRRDQPSTPPNPYPSTDYGHYASGTTTSSSSSTTLMRWTCMYRATLIQENFNVENFPHDEHDLCLKLGVLSRRQQGARFDRAAYRLDLATEEDTQGTTRRPEGLIVDHARVPDFSHNKHVGLRFSIEPLSVGLEQSVENENDNARERCVAVRLTVVRDSGYYDRNILPLLCALNCCAACLFVMPANEFFKRALCLLNISFLEIGLRMSMDKTLPSVGYQIKMQKILNRFFYGLLVLVVESALVYFCCEHLRVPLSVTARVDALSAAAAIFNMVDVAFKYYAEMRTEAIKLL